MSNIAIRVENLGKRYRIGQYVGSGSQYRTLRESLTNAFSAPFRRLRAAQVRSKKQGVGSNLRPKTQDPRPKTIWALKDVSFEVKRGEVLGIIGRNGAGKSTLLKILTRITEPTEGRAELNGRVGSLLEVGTGFHPELTGRENIYLSGAVLGMTRKEIDRKFDEIVDFSGVEKFIDTPGKRYSSGMRVRLGFAVAAHLEPEILLIDEVLAVGDVAFQKKCLGKMEDVARGGRTVLFVSHNMGVVRQLCQKGILLQNGFLEQYGNVTNVINSYLHDNIHVSNSVTFKDDNFSYPIFIKSATILNEKNEPSMFFQMGDEIKFRVTLERRDKMVPEALAVNIKTSGGELITNIHSQDANFMFDSSMKEETINIAINKISYYPDKYYVTLVLKTPDQRFIKKHDCLMFEVTQNRRLTERRLITAHGRYFVESSWSHFQEEETINESQIH